MSYARFGSNGSDVYVFLAVGGWLECCSCRLNPVLGTVTLDLNPGTGGLLLELAPPGEGAIQVEHEVRDNFLAYTTADMLAHLDAHEAAGHVVPPATRDGLLADQAENDADIARGNDD